MSIFIAAQQKKISALRKVLENDGLTDICGTSCTSRTLFEDISASRTFPDSLVAMNGGSEMKDLPSTLLKLRRQYQQLKIVFLAGFVDTSSAQTKKALDSLKKAGINVITGNPKPGALADLLDQRITVDDGLDNTEEIPVTIPNNIFVVSSAKAGSGKSFVSTNLAAILAQNGRRRDGERPTVLLVEGDLQTLSVGTLLGIEDDSTHNLKEALRRIREIVDSDGNVKGTPEQQRSVQEFIQECCFLVTEDIPNWATLVSTNFSLREREEVSPYHYFYLINVLASLFDIVIVDSNSAIEHKTTGPVLQAAREIMMVVTSDYDGVRIATKAQQEFATIGVEDKIVYVLNKWITKAQRSRSPEESHFSVKDYFDMSKVAAKIPYIDQIVQYNCIYGHRPLVLTKTKETLVARIEFTRLAGRIWPMDNTKQLEKEVETLRNSRR